MPVHYAQQDNPLADARLQPCGAIVLREWIAIDRTPVVTSNSLGPTWTTLSTPW
jgi:hypothetical protein